MSDESSYTAVGDEALEARIVAWVLGEASAFEAEELEKLCVEREELGVFKRRIERMHGLMEAEVREGADEAWSLPEAKRSAVEQLLENGEEKARERSVRRSGRRAMVAIAACVVVSLFGVWMMPRGYEGKVVVEVRPRAGGMSPLGEGMRDESGPMSAQFFGTEFEKIKSRESLEKVVENLDLDARWGVDKEDALGRLRGIVDAQNIRGTDLVEIKVRAGDKGDAKEIAEEVAETYAAYRREWETEASRRSLEELKKAIRDQEEKVEERRKVLSTIVRTKGVIHKGEDRFYGRGGEGEQREETVKRGLDAQDYVDAKRAFETDVALLQEMKIKQIAETISSETPAGNAVIVHDSSVEDRSLFQWAFGGKAEGTVAEAPTVTTYSAALAEQEEKGQDEDGEGMVALKTEFPAEMIEGTPKPMNVPGLVDERDGPVIAGRMRYGRGQEKQDSNWKESSNGVVVGGQVLSPGTVNFADGMKLGDAVDGAGGASDFASKKRVRVMRDGVLKQYDLNSKEGRELQLQAGDVVEVPQKSVFGDGERLPGNERLRGRPEAAVDFAKTAPVQSAPAAWVSGVADRERSAGKSSSSSELADGGADEGGVGVETRYFFSDADGGVKAVPEPAARPQPRPEVVRKPVVASGGVAADEAAVSSSLFAEAGKHESKQNVDAFAASDVPEVADVPMLGRMFRSKEKGRKVDVNGRERELPDLSNAATMAENRTRVDEVRKDLYLAEGNLKLGKLDVAKRKYEDALGVDPGNLAARRGLEKLAKQEAASYRAAYDSTRAELLAEVDAAWELKVPAEVVEFEGFINYGAPIDGVAGKDGVDADAFNANATDGDDWSGVIRDKLEADLEVVDGEVEKLAEQAELENRPAVTPARKSVVFEEENSAAEEPYSTFSLNISDASFQVAQAALARGEQPDPAGIKVEQFYNGVDYGDPGPVGEEPVAVTIEQAAHPVVPGRNLVRVAVKTAAAGRGEGQPLRLTLLVDQSGSMAREDRRGAMDEARGGLAELLTENDRVSVIGFSRRARLLAEAMGGEKADGLAELVNQGAAEGGT
ncbi:MAG: VWA domain-containing protein, partial [Verrucomicrobiales bacterium]